MTALEEFIEKVGLYYEGFGLSKMSGRILGYLMAADKDLLTFEEIMSQLKASKGSISENIRLLLLNKLVERVMITGNRKSYYRFINLNIHHIIEEKIKAFAISRELFQKANAINKNHKSSKYKAVAEIIDFYYFLEKEILKIKDRWFMEKEKNK